MFFRFGEFETWGRGIKRIFTACKDAGARRPELTFDGTGLTLEFRHAPEYLRAMPASESSPTPPVTPEVAPEVTDPVLKLSLVLKESDLAPSLLRQRLQLRHRLTSVRAPR